MLETIESQKSFYWISTIELNQLNMETIEFQKSQKLCLIAQLNVLQSAIVDYESANDMILIQFLLLSCCRLIFAFKKNTFPFLTVLKRNCKLLLPINQSIYLFICFVLQNEKHTNICEKKFSKAQEGSEMTIRSSSQLPPSKSGLFKLGVAIPRWVSKGLNGGRGILDFNF